MKKSTKVTRFDFITSNEETGNILSSMKSNQKVYCRLVEGLRLLGNFTGKTEVEVFDTLTVGDNKKIRLCCFDDDSRLFIFYGESFDINDLLKLSREDDKGTIKYDLSLAKKYELNSGNIDFTRTGNIYGLKFGRLITNWTDFYSLFLRDDIGYQIRGDFSSSFDKNIINLINSFDQTPKLADCILVFESMIKDEQISFSKMNVKAFKNLELLGSFTIDGDLQKGYVPKLTKKED